MFAPRIILTYLLILAVGGSPAWGAEGVWNSSGPARWKTLTVPPSGRTGFTLLPPQATGIEFTNTLSEWAAESNRVLANGSGVAVGDFDGDGLPDLFICGLEGRNVLYRNLGGFHFQDVTAASGIVLTNFYCRGAVFADLNGDGRLDLLVAVTGAGVKCFLNEGGGHFSDQSEASGLSSRYGTISMALADVDGDGTLDLYVVNNRSEDIRDRGEVELKMSNGKVVIPPEFQGRLLVVGNRMLEYGEPSFLYLNDGHAHFTAASWTNGTFLSEGGQRFTRPPLDWGLTATFRDMNGDGAPDLYVCNDYWTPDRVWINDGHGHFRALDNRGLRNTSASSMGVDFADLNHSGHYDFLVVDMLSRDPAMRRRQMPAQDPIPISIGSYNNRPQFLRNTLQIARGDGTYAEVANFAGLAAADWAWCPLFIDVDLDGYQDVLITVGHFKDVQDLDASDAIRAIPNVRERTGDLLTRREAFVRQKLANAKMYPKLDMPICAFRNLGGYRFEETTTQWGTDTPGVHHALAVADFDGDGDLDLAVNNLGSPFGIYRNESSGGRVNVRLRGRAPNTQGIGAQVSLKGGAAPLQHQEAVSGGRYMAGSNPEIVFATGATVEGMTLEVVWRDGRRSIIHDVGANRVYEIEESTTEPPADRGGASDTGAWFEDRSGLLGYVAVEQAFDDFARQPLLPRKLSQLGPGVAWIDLDGDGWDDLVVGGACGARVGAFRNDQEGHFSRWTNAPFDQVWERDTAGLAVHCPTSGSIELLVALSNYEDGTTRGAAVMAIDQKHPVPERRIAAFASAVGPLALADLNGDGRLNLFVGGRVVPGRYPEKPESRLFLGNEAGFQLDEKNTRLLESAGMVSGAVWGDLDGDGHPDLILACEWGPIRVFHNQNGLLSEATSALGLSGFSGWWNGVNVGDFDGDGRLDIVASNWGLNTPYQASPERPNTLYFGEFSDSGYIDLIETEYDPIRHHFAARRFRKDLTAAIPDLLERFPNHRAYGEASIETILGPLAKRAGKVEAHTLASTVFLNRGDHFDPLPLPREAQWSPAFAVVVADFDGDGHEDVFLSQNFTPNQPEVPRQDAGRGLLLRGDGTGHFEPVDGASSGVLVYGDQRGAAACDYDGDGRVDLVVAQSASDVRLFHNRRAKPGVRVRLKGPPHNPLGIGAVLRLKVNGRWGPAREIHAGAGYYSQDSEVQVLGSDGSPDAVWVRWPGGAVSETPVRNRRELEIVAPGRP